MIVNEFIISMTNYWMLIGYIYGSKIILFVKYKQNHSKKIQTKHQILAKSLAELPYNVFIENYHLHKLDEALEVLS